MLIALLGICSKEELEEEEELEADEDLASREYRMITCLAKLILVQ